MQVLRTAWFSSENHDTQELCIIDNLHLKPSAQSVSSSTMPGPPRVSYSNALSSKRGYPIAPPRGQPYSSIPRAPQNLGASRAQGMQRAKMQNATMSKVTEKLARMDLNWTKMKKQILDKDRCRVGMIIRAPLHEQDWQAGATTNSTGPKGDDFESGKSDITNDRSVSEWKHGYIHTKVRIFVVAAKFHHHFLAAPVYTHGRRGLRNKNRDYQEEHVSIFDKSHGPKNPERLQEGPHPYLYADLGDHAPHYKTMSTIHFTRLVPRGYGLECSIEGDLNAKSLPLFLNHCNDATQKFGATR
ncbi:hypothetical protein HO173_001607 [Letharia columbiana]|uniref:DUF6590 domain-containing protein n=1 Tax=Letharia columbiana TaxID=112416 RepID=A0A8H6L8U4_9LECA|nr:uncharacterized protein HO173_001607 [Letharia columbiana]KAF6239999.1 hypothetical protein HO173_001607 [Letharia columbiana]